MTERGGGRGEADSRKGKGKRGTRKVETEK
jgi:hypothetical protein